MPTLDAKIEEKKFDDANFNNFVEKIRNIFFENFFKMLDFQITGSDQIWVLNKTLESFKTNG
jgi:predicted YcjX-like family ATPase